MKKIFAVLCAICVMILSLGLSACNNKTQYTLSVTGSELLYESLNSTYTAGKEVKVKAKINPYENVSVTLDDVELTKQKSSQNKYWEFTFKMPSHDANLNIQSYKGFNEPLLYGFYVTFNDAQGQPIEDLSKPVNSEDAIADYAIIYQQDGYQVVSKNKGANVFANRKSLFGDFSFELEDTLYYTYELIDSLAVVNSVSINDVTQDIYTNSNYPSYSLGRTNSFTIPFTQNLSDKRYNSSGEEYEHKFNSSVKINFKYIDYLTNVNVLEYGATGELIKSSNVTGSESNITQTASSNCEFVVIEEEYTIKAGTHSGEKYVERTLINKTDSKLGGGKQLKFPRGNGLILPTYLSINW